MLDEEFNFDLLECLLFNQISKVLIKTIAMSRLDDIVQNLQSHNWLETITEQKEDNFREKLTAERRDQWPFKDWTLKNFSEFHNNAQNNYHSSNYFETFTLSFIMMRDRRRNGDFEGKNFTFCLRYKEIIL